MAPQRGTSGGMQDAGRSLRLTMQVLLIAGALAACTDSPTGDRSVSPATTPLLASMSVAGIAASRVAFISLPPGTVADGRDVAIRNGRTGRTALTQLLDGGFDPVAITAAVGDTIHVSVTGGPLGATTELAVVVPRPLPPTIVRTNPPKNKRDVPLNAVVVVVFSEPIDAASLTSTSFQLHIGEATVDGRLAFEDSSHTSATFVPAHPLVPGMDYALVVTRAVRDLDGMALTVPLGLSFTTSAEQAPPPPTAPLTLSHPYPHPESGSYYQFPGDTDRVIYVAVRPGSIDIALSLYARVLNERSGKSVTAHTTEGGFDPVIIPARVGDVIAVTSAGASIVLRDTVRASSTPQLLRSNPSSDQQAAEVAGTFYMVFTEPVDLGMSESAPTPPVWLMGASGESVVTSGMWNWWFNQAVLGVGVVRDSSLAPGASYTLVADGLRTTDGAPLGTVRVPFRVASASQGAFGADLSVSLTMLEIEGSAPGEPSSWSYAPQIRVTEGGRGAARLTTLAFRLGDALADSSKRSFFNGQSFVYCAPGVPVGMGATTDLVGEVYGSWEFEMMFGGTARAGADVIATAGLVFRDAAGRADTVLVHGPIVPGTQPGTYSGGFGHGYYPIGSYPGCR